MFAAVQINDPDPTLWIIAYITTGITPLLYIWNNTFNKLSKIFMVILCIITMCYLYNVLSYFIYDANRVHPVRSNSGEIAREFFGLCLSWATFFYYHKKSHR